jgi:hypothetical protein
MRDRFTFFKVSQASPFFKLIAREESSTKSLRNVSSYNDNDKALAYIL